MLKKHLAGKYFYAANSLLRCILNWNIESLRLGFLKNITHLMEKILSTWLVFLESVLTLSTLLRDIKRGCRYFSLSKIYFSLSLLTLSSLKFDDFRSDAQRAAKQKEAKERELEQCSFSAERIEEGGFPLSMVRWRMKKGF